MGFLGFLGGESLTENYFNIISLTTITDVITLQINHYEILKHKLTLLL